MTLFNSFGKSNDPLIIEAYFGYGNSSRFFLKGRVLENEGIFEEVDQSKIRKLINSFKRFETDEIPFTTVELIIEGEKYSTQTDEEGYFIFHEEWSLRISKHKTLSVTGELRLTEFEHEDGSAITTDVKVYIPSPTASYGIISDIDDTVLQTHITSLFKLKMIYATLIENSYDRLPMEGVVELYNKFRFGYQKKHLNPFFYVSQSPWNLHDLIARFMKLQELPNGPILLRDYGIRPSGSFATHKLDSIAHILEMYPKLPFILLGDTGGKDADHYLELARKFRDQISTIYIRETRNNKNARRVSKLIESQTDINIVRVLNSHEIETHARAMKLI